MSMRIYKAEAGDLPAVLSLLIERAAWMRQRGSRQWAGDLLAPERIAGIAERGGTYLAVAEDATPLGTITISPDGDPDFWTETEKAQPAMYVSKMATSLEHRGLGSPLLRWALDKAWNAGIPLVRLDVIRDPEAEPLRQWYNARGFTHLRDVAVEGKNSGALFEAASWPDPDAALRFCRPAEHSGHRNAAFPVGSPVFADFWGPGVVIEVEEPDAGDGPHFKYDDQVRRYRVRLETGRVVWCGDVDLEPISERVTA
jgi:GNAT superfamily N-acetyltransferase